MAEELSTDSWVLVGGQMVMLHGLIAGRVATRASHDIDMLADLVSSSSALRRCVHAVRRLGFEPRNANDQLVLHRFVRPIDQAIIDVLAPDHSPPGWPTTTVPPRTTIRIDGGRQALQRAASVEVVKGGRRVWIPVPSVLGALILKGAAYQVDQRDPERHLYDAAFLASMIVDPIATKAQLKGSDAKRLRMLDRRLSGPDDSAWLALGEHRQDAYTRWSLLVS